MTWLKEAFTPNEYHLHRIRRILVKKQTPFQKLILADSPSFGRCLILDGEMQSAEKDEFIYHESLVHPAMLLHGGPKNALVLGGGEGATCREILKYKSVKEVLMVDIDREVIEFCKRYLKTWHQGAFEDPRLTLIIEDAEKYIRQTQARFDLIVSDLPTAIEGGPAYRLYTREFYRVLSQRLAPGGIFVLQAGSGNLLQLDFHKVLYSTLRSPFPLLRPYYAFVPSFDVPWAFYLCTLNKNLDPMKLSAQEVDARISRRLPSPLRFIDGLTFEGIFRVPKYLREILEKERRKNTLKRPVYFFK